MGSEASSRLMPRAALGPSTLDPAAPSAAFGPPIGRILAVDGYTRCASGIILWSKDGGGHLYAAAIYRHKYGIKLNAQGDAL